MRTNHFQAELIKSADLEELAPDTRKAYEAHATGVIEVPCYRNNVYGFERVFVVARHGNRVSAFDDVEDEFAVGDLVDDGVLRHWGLYGTLTIALANLSA